MTLSKQSPGYVVERKGKYLSKLTMNPTNRPRNLFRASCPEEAYQYRSRPLAQEIADFLEAKVIEVKRSTP